MKNSVNDAKPAGLSAEAKKLRRLLLAERQIDDAAGLAILRTALESLDRLRSVQAQIRKDGMTLVDRWGQVKGHPLLATERDARAQFLAALKALHLDFEPLKSGFGRPAGAY